MHIAMKFIILVIVLTTIFIVYNLLKTRSAIKKQAETELQKKEGFTTVDDMNQRDYPLSIQPLQPKYSDLHLREFVVKSSYNSAHFNEDGGVDVEAISAVLKRGCRLLDFEVTSDLTTKNLTVGNIPLSTIFSRVSSQAFTTFSPSPYSPLFLHLRSSSAINVISLLTNAFPTTLYKDTNNKAIEVTGSTKLRDIMGKVIVISSDNTNFANIEVNKYKGITKLTETEFTRQNRNKILPKGDELSTTIDTFDMVVPDTDHTNIDSTSIFEHAYPQFILYKFYEGGNKNLDNYEDIFNDAQSSLVTISYLIGKSTVDTDAIKKQERKIKSAVPSKPAAPLGNGWF